MNIKTLIVAGALAAAATTAAKADYVVFEDPGLPSVLFFEFDGDDVMATGAEVIEAPSAGLTRTRAEPSMEDDEMQMEEAASNEPAPMPEVLRAPTPPSVNAGGLSAEEIGNSRVEQLERMNASDLERVAVENEVDRLTGGNNLGLR